MPSFLCIRSRRHFLLSYQNAINKGFDAVNIRQYRILGDRFSLLLFGLRSPAPSAPRLMPPVAPPLGTAVTVAAGAAVAIGSELVAQFGDKFLLCCRSWNTKE